MKDWLLLIVLIALWCLLRFGYPRFRHWLIHRCGWSYGEFVRRVEAMLNTMNPGVPPPPLEVHLEPDDLGKPYENCVGCGQETRYWLPDNHTALCQECCAKRNAAVINRTTLANREYQFVSAVLKFRDRLATIASGQTERGRRVSQYDAKPGKRPIKPKEMIEMAKHAAACLNTAVNKFQAGEPKPWDWDKFENKY